MFLEVFLSSSSLSSHLSSQHLLGLLLPHSVSPIKGPLPSPLQSSTATLLPTIHVFRLHSSLPESSSSDPSDDTPTHTLLSLPSRSLDGLWESLCYSTSAKTDLIDYAVAVANLSHLGVDSNICSVNRTVLLYGPPGTGKTSLAKALAHKLAIRTASVYRDATLLEVNSHSLFSRWFSESGKKIHALFEHVQELCEDSESLVVVLVDEVESLTAARGVASGEPSDGVSFFGRRGEGRRGRGWWRWWWLWW